MSFANECVKSAIKEKISFNYRELSDSMGTNKSNVYACIAHNRAWTADKWLKCMFALNKAKMDGNKIIIESDVLDKYADQLRVS